MDTILIFFITYAVFNFHLATLKIMDITIILLTISYFIRSLRGLTSFTNTFHITYTGATRIEDVLILEKAKTMKLKKSVILKRISD